MKLSEQKEYLEAIPDAERGDYTSAINKLESLITKAKYEGDIDSEAYLCQVLGNIEAKAGNIDVAMSLHNKALTLRPNNPLEYLIFSKGLYYSFNNSDLALNKLEKLRDLLNSGNWVNGENEPSHEWYYREIEKLETEIKNKA